jgi:phosphoribosylaminoimidazole-succinocarboxamide synthase
LETQKSFRGDVMSTAKLLHVGSVKDIYDEENADELTFLFSDRYSVFDWGEMPNHIQDKGKCLSLMAKYFFTLLSDRDEWSRWYAKKERSNIFTPQQKEMIQSWCDKGLLHHYLGESKQLADGLRVKRFHIPNVKINDSYDYSYYNDQVGDCLIPLEVIFRFGIPKGSSLPARQPKFKVGQTFDKPLIEFSTKLEASDRYISRDEAITMAGFSEGEITHFCDQIELLSLRLKDFFDLIGLELWDGKFEFALDSNRNFILVDTIGPDELRLMVDDVPLSKEFLREYYESTPWKVTLGEMKALDPVNWKKNMIAADNLPRQLDDNYQSCFTQLYKSLVNKLYGEGLFSNTLSFENVILEMKKIRSMRS